MIVRVLIKPNSYYGSLVLMRIGTQAAKLPGVVDAAAIMGTEQNKRAIGNSALLTDEVKAAGPNDLLLVVAADTEARAQAALDFALKTLAAGQEKTDRAKGVSLHTLDAALRRQPNSNLAILSIPGRYVRREALKALDAGLNLFIFSDNVSLEDESELKQVARERGLLVMGPDCGTGIVNGAALGFANAVRRGRIGLVGASGTGLQEVSCLIDRLGRGVSHAIGTGTHDVGVKVGGTTLTQGLMRLEEDSGTDVVVIVSKPPAPAVVHEVMATVKACRKPTVVNFLDGDPEVIAAGGGIVARTLEDAAVLAVAALGGEADEAVRNLLLAEAGDVATQAEEARTSLIDGQRYVRGVFSGGTFANEAAMLLCDLAGTVYTNGSIKKAAPLPDPRRSQGHTCVDLGEDIFTVGRPHPMLEPVMRRERLLAEAEDPETAVVLLDVVIGYGAHPDPAGALVELIREARQLAKAEGRNLPIVASVCGVDADPQNRTVQVRKLEAAGVLVMPSNFQATCLAAQIATGLGPQGGRK
jgi:FdrA protein